MPPAAFQAKNRHQRMCETPAIHAAVTRRIEKNRPMKIVFAPCRWKKRSDQGSTEAVQRLANDQRSSSLRPPVPPDPVAHVVAEDGRGRRDGDHGRDVQLTA